MTMQRGAANPPGSRPAKAHAGKRFATGRAAGRAARSGIAGPDRA